MTDEYLARGFADVDNREDPASYLHCLALLDALPYYREYKERSYELLELAPGLTVLEVGAGIGDDAFRMAERVMPGGRVVAVDASARMMEAACLRIPAGLDVEFQQADARELPFADAGFNRCRIDRTLQHIKNPDKAVLEMVRVLEPGGLLLAYDNDWGQFSINGTDEAAARTVATLWCDSFTNGRIGRLLKGSFVAAGLLDIRVYPSVSVITDFETADRVYNLALSADRAVKEGLLARERAARWLADLKRLSTDRLFRCTLTAYTVVGRKPYG